MPEDGVSPLSLLSASIKAVPAVKYALGVGGLISVIAIIASFKIDFRIAVFGIVVMFILMTVLVILAHLTAQHTVTFKVPIIVFTWFSILLTMATAIALFGSVFLGRPIDLRSVFALPQANLKTLNEQTQPAEDHPVDSPGGVGNFPTSSSTTSASEASIRSANQDESKALRIENDADRIIYEAIGIGSCLDTSNCDFLRPDVRNNEVRMAIYKWKRARGDWAIALDYASKRDTLARLRAKIKGEVGLTCRRGDKILCVVNGSDRNINLSANAPAHASPLVLP